MSEIQPLYLLTRRMIIRSYRLTDEAQYIQRMRENPSTSPFNVEKTQKLFKDRLDQKPGLSRFFLIAAFDLNNDCDLILDMNFVSQKQGVDKDFWVSYHTVKAHRERGYMKEALKPVLDHLIAKYGIQKVTAMVPQDNQASQNTARRVGFRLEPESRSIWIYRP